MLLPLFALAAAGCSDSTSGPPDNEIDAAPVLLDIGSKVILATYVDLDTKATALNAAVTTFNTTPTEANLNAAKQAWRDARRPWEQSEAFLFGPVDTKGIDPAIDDWPLNKIDLDAVLASDAELTKDYVDGLETSQKGFHTIEYLLFGEGNTKTAAQSTAREREYLIAATQSFKGETAKLRQSWDPAGENYLAQFTGAGASSTVYLSAAVALEEAVRGMMGICDEVATGKISGPFAEQDRTQEESQFSDNSNTDFQDNIRSVQNVYRGYYTGTSGRGIGFIVASLNSSLDVRVRQEIDAAIAAIGGMQPSFGRAITDNKPSVEAALTAVNKLHETLERDVLPLMKEE